MKKIIYLNLSPEQLTYEIIEPLRQQAAIHFNVMTSKLGFQDRAGNSVAISVNVEGMNPQDKYFYNGRASKIGHAGYRIVFGGGLLARLDALSRAITADRKTMKGLTATTLIGQQIRRDGRPKALSNFVFHYMLDLILWHEVAHIALGHVDWLAKEFGATEYAETPAITMSPEEAAARIILEGDADRQAALWSVSTYDLSLKQNVFLRYRSKLDAFYDFGYIVGAMFSMFEALSDSKGKKLKSHPAPQQRIAVVLVSVNEYLQNIYKEASAAIYESSVKGAFQALNDIVSANKRPLDVGGTINYLEEHKAKINALGVRNFQLAPNKNICSFDLSMV